MFLEVLKQTSAETADLMTVIVHKQEEAKCCSEAWEPDRNMQHIAGLSNTGGGGEGRRGCVATGLAQPAFLNKRRDARFL